MIFRYKDKEYNGATAIEVVKQIERDDANFDASQTGGAIQGFIEWSLKNLSDHLPLRELDLSRARVSDEVRAHDYLSLHRRAGRMKIEPNFNKKAQKSRSVESITYEQFSSQLY